MTVPGTLVVFTADGCPHCAALRADLALRRVAFEEVNLSRTPEHTAELARLCPERRLPVVVDHERISVGFHGASSGLAELGLE